MATTPPLPAGYSLADGPPPPPGYQVTGDSQQPASQPAQQQAATSTPPPETLGSRVARGLKATVSTMLDPLQGAGEGVLDTAGTVAQATHDIGEHLHKGLGETLMPQDGIDQLRQIAKPDNTMQGVSKGVEGVAEFMLGDEALKGLSLTEKLAKIAPAVQRLEKSPTLLRIAQTAIRQGAVGTVQAAAHGDSTAGSLLSGAVAGAAGGAGEGLGQLYSAIKPVEETYAGVKTPLLRSQTAGGSKIGAGGDIPKAIREAQQAGSQQRIINTAQQATRDALERVNATRNPAAMLPEATLPEDFEFQVDTGKPPAATPSGQPAALTDGTRALPGKGQTAAAPAESATTFRTKDPAEAQRALSQMNEYADTEAYDTMHPEERANFDRARTSLEDQLGMYHAAQRGPGFAPVDSRAIAAKVGSFGEAADQIRASVQPVYQKLDQISGGKFDALRKQFTAANKVIKNGTSLDAIEAAEQRADEASKGIDDLIDQHRDQISHTDYTAAKTAWRDSKILDRIHAHVEGMFNGVPQDVAARNPQTVARTINKARTERIGRLIDKGGRADVERVIGQDGLDNLYRLSSVLQKPEQARSFAHLLNHVGVHLAGRAGTGALIGAGIAGATGHDRFEGVLIGAGVGAGGRFALRQMATNPGIGKMVAYAVEHGVDPKIAVPLIAGSMSNAAQAATTPDTVSTGTSEGNEGAPPQ